MLDAGCCQGKIVGIGALTSAATAAGSPGDMLETHRYAPGSGPRPDNVTSGADYWSTRTPLPATQRGLDQVEEELRSTYLGWQCGEGQRERGKMRRKRRLRCRGGEEGGGRRGCVQEEKRQSQEPRAKWAVVDGT